MKTVFLKTSEAVANFSGAMEARDHRLQSVADIKNGASPKSQMSRKNMLYGSGSVVK